MKLMFDVALLGALLLAALPHPQANASPATTTVQVPTSQGIIEGLSNENGQYFLGIRYAQAPVGDLRWRRPRPPLNWTGVYNATSYGADCLQFCSNSSSSGRRVGGWYTINGLENMSEDCLFLNIVTPAPDNTTRWPVIVYLHAGEFYMGAGNDLENNWPYDSDPSLPSALAQHGVIIVTLNYRLSNLGFLAADELRSRDAAGSTGNYGIQDQRQALRWINDNIEAFGGDPNNVILAGESSGGTGVAAHLVMKESWGLFHKVIMQSPGFTQIKPWDRAYLDAQYLMAQTALAPAAAPSCQMIPFGGDFDTPGAWTLYPMPLSGTIYATGVYDSVRDAVNDCNINSTCVGVQYANNTNDTTITASFSTQYKVHPGGHISPAPAPSRFEERSWDERQEGVATNSFVDDSAGRNLPENVATYLRSPNMSLFVDCLLGQTGKYLAESYDGPFQDTIFENLYGPVPDGVEFNGSLVSNLLSGDLPPNITYLIGTNLDEGTEFVGYTAPSHTCNMSDSGLRTWAYETFKNIESIADNISAVYSNITLPVPQCKNSTLDFPVTKNHIIATRAVGDGTFFCLVRALADRLVVHSDVQVPGSVVYNYFWTHKPATSLNMASLDSEGAFHGSEVPFVFGYPAELATPEEISLSASMSCYWANFAWSGNPNVGKCNNSLLAPVEWTQYRTPGSDWTGPTNTLLFGIENTSIGEVGTHMVQNLRDGLCPLFAPLWNGTVRPNDRLPIRSLDGRFYSS